MEQDVSTPRTASDAGRFDAWMVFPGIAAVFACLALVAGHDLPAAFGRQLENAVLVVIVVSIISGAASALTARKPSPGAAL